jgi:AcrR family transcriptional regulator
MGIQERKEREKEALRGRIIEAATELFREETYANVSMRKIAARVEYSVGTLYLYYRDKDELFLAVQEAAFERAFEFIQQLPDSEDPLERLRGLGERYIQFGLKNPDLYRLMFMMEHPMQALEEGEGWRAGIKLHSLLSSLVEECMNKGRLPQQDPLKMSFMLWSMVHGMVSLKITCRLDIYNGTHLPACENLNRDVDDMLHGTNNMVINLLNKLAE